MNKLCRLNAPTSTNNRVVLAASVSPPLHTTRRRMSPSPSPSVLLRLFVATTVLVTPPSLVSAWAAPALRRRSSSSSSSLACYSSSPSILHRCHDDGGCANLQPAPSLRQRTSVSGLSSSSRRRDNMFFQPKSRLSNFLPLQAAATHSSSSSSSSTTAEDHHPTGQHESFTTTTTTTTSNNNSNNTPLKRIKLYNSRTRQKEVLVPVTEGKITMYTCGPTVYDYAHVGNFRAFLTYDLLKRVFLRFGYNVEHVCNLTDVDDKIIARATRQGLNNVLDLTRRFEGCFFDDLFALNIVPASHYPRATEHIAEMMEIISLLHGNGLAYETTDGSWYFRTQSQPGYGTQLIQNMNWSDMESQQQQENSRSSGDAVAVADEKEHFADFCLWKAFKEGYDREDAAWSSESIMQVDVSNKDCSILVNIQKGRPGWHLECSAMARKFFGDATIDLHGGGIDLKFPHHENEIAQSQGIRQRQPQSRNKITMSTSDNDDTIDSSSSLFCNCWFHNGFVNIASGDDEDDSASGVKMSKSLGNGRTLREACPTAVDVRAYRYLVVSSQYRNPLAFTPKAMQASKNAIVRMDKIRQRIHDALDAALANDNDESTSSPSVLTEKTIPQALAASVLYQKTIPAALADFEAALVDDLSMPRASAALFSIIKAVEHEFNRHEKGGDDAGGQQQHDDELDIVGLQSALNAMNEMDKIFGIFYDVPLTPEEQQNIADSGDQSSSSRNVNGGGVPDDVLDLVAQRTAAKEAKDWALADSLRSRIADLGFAVQDVKGGEPIVTRL